VSAPRPVRTVAAVDLGAGSGLSVLCGPVEASSLGDAAMHLMALCELNGLAAQLRDRTQDDDRQRGPIPT
jgi:hypothetical protein